MKLNVLICMKHFIQMIIMMNLVIHAILVSLQAVVPYPTKFLTKSHWIIYKRKKNRKISMKWKETKSKDKNAAIKEKDGTIQKKRVISVSIKIDVIINLKRLSKEYNQLLVVPLQKNARKQSFLVLAFKKSCEWKNLIILLKTEKFP